MKIIIVDDEILVRIGIKSCVDWEKHGIELIGEAEDGLKAIEMIEALKPDAVLLDIKMPKMDGLQVMRLGMSDYLHKPRMSPKDIVSALMTVKENIEKAKSANDDSFKTVKIESSNSINRELLLRQLISGIGLSSKIIKNKLAESGVKLGVCNYTCILFSISNLETIAKRYEGNERNVLQSYVNNILSGVLENEEGVEYLPYNENIHALLTSSIKSESESFANGKINMIIELVSEALLRFLNVKAVFGISDIFNDFSEIPIAFSQASKALNIHFYRNAKKCIYFRELAKCEISSLRLQTDKLVSELKDLLIKKEFAKATNTFDKLTESLSLSAFLTEQEAKGLMNGLLFLSREDQSSLADMQRISNCETFDDLCSTYKDIFLSHSKLDSHTVSKTQYSYLVKRILAFLSANFASEITLKSISNNLQISPNYVSKIVKAETGKSPFELLNSIRIDHAKKLLADGSLKIYEVGYKVGFNSPVHFTIVFSKHMNMSPKQFRETLLL